MYEECVERIIRHEAEPSALLGLETHSEYTISVMYESTRYFNWFIVVCGAIQKQPWQKMAERQLNIMARDRNVAIANFDLALYAIIIGLFR